MPELETLIVEGVPFNQEVVKKIEEIVSTIYAREAVVVYEGLEGDQASRFRLLSQVVDAAKRTSLLCTQDNVEHCAKLASMLGCVELVVLVGECKLQPSLLEKLKVAYEQGLDSMSLYIYGVAPDKIHRIQNVLSMVLESRLPLHVRIGPKPFTPQTNIQNLHRVFDEVGLPYGMLYGYTARRAVLSKMLVTLLEPPCPRACKRLSLRKDGVVKCPLRPSHSLPYSEAILDKIKEIVESPCEGAPRVRDSRELRVKVSIIYNGVEIPEDVLNILVAVKMLRSFRVACKSLGMNPSHMIVRIRRIESKIGSKLIEGHRGGRGGGYTVLTEVGEEIVKKYLEVKGLIAGLEEGGS